MRGLPVVAGLLLLGFSGGVRAADPCPVTLHDERTPAKDDPVRQGLEFVERRVSLGNLDFRYRQLVDPKQADLPVVKGYGDFFLACGFPPGTWNWNQEYFLDASVVRPGAPPFTANRATLQAGTYIVESGTRGVVDMVWPLPPLPGPQVVTATTGTPGRLAVRVVKIGPQTQWFFMELGLEDAGAAEFGAITLAGFPVVTSGPPERQRWAVTPSRALQLGTGQVPLDPATECVILLHNKFDQEDGGELVVMDPDEVKAVTVGGVYPVAIVLVPKPGRSTLHVALGYFWDTPYGRASDEFRRQAPGVRDQLRRLDWDARRDAAAWTRQRQEYAELVRREKLTGDAVNRWQALAAEGDRLLAPAGTAPVAATGQRRADDRRAAALLRDVKGLGDELYALALAAVVKDEVK